MRPFALLTVILLALPAVALPTVGSLAPSSTTTARPVDARAPLLPADVPDAVVLRLLAARIGLEPRALPQVAVPADLTLPDALQRLAARAGADLAPEDAATFAALDPRVAEPVLALLVAVDLAWDLRDEAFAGLAPHEQAELAALHRAATPGTPPTPREVALSDAVDRAALLTAAILLLDTLERLVLPALQDAVAQGAWPEESLADPIGLLRLGSPGDDLETLDRMIQIDPKGNDVYRNNAGGTTVLNDLDPTTLDFPIAVSVDFEGEDEYWHTVNRPSLGAAFLGIGFLFDFNGADHYSCKVSCLGWSQNGLALLRDLDGEDEFDGGSFTAGSSNFLSVLRDDAGDDWYHVRSGSGGSSRGDASIGLLWDRAGQDAYTTSGGAYMAYGYSDFGGGHGWLADEGPDTDFFQTEESTTDPHGCNNCTWVAGQPGRFAANGRGNDNSGGLGALLTEDGAVLRR